MNATTVAQNTEIAALVPVSEGEIGGTSVRTVNARDLHTWLEVGKKFADWIQDRVEQYGFTQDVDYIVIPEIGKNGGRPRNEYAIALDMAKELAMVERTPKGKEARLYFIDCERRAQAAALPQDYLSALKELVTTLEEKKALEQDNALLNTIIDNEFGYSSILRAAQYLGVNEKTFNWRPLKRWTLESGLEVKRVPSPRFPYQNLYPIAAFEHCYPQFDFSGLQPEVVANRATKLLAGQVAAAFH